MTKEDVFIGKKPAYESFQKLLGFKGGKWRQRKKKAEKKRGYNRKKRGMVKNRTGE